VPAFGDLIIVDEFGIRPLCPTSGSLIDLVRKNSHGYRDGDVFNLEKI
jgi:hypothetical protein